MRLEGGEPPSRRRLARLAGALHPRRCGCCATWPSSSTPPHHPAADGALSLRPLGATIGAEVRGIDVSQPLGPATNDAICAALDEWGVLCFRDQRQLTWERQIEFAREAFHGDVRPHELWGHEEWMRMSGNVDRTDEGLPPHVMLFVSATTTTTTT